MCVLIKKKCVKIAIHAKTFHFIGKKVCIFAFFFVSLQAILCVNIFNY